jgi:gliding motility-associated-like protein
MPTIVAYAGRDTSIVADQALQLIATGGTRYFWSPSTGLSNPNIANPIALLGANIDSITYKVSVFDNNGCTAVDDMKVRIYKSQPDIFVPTAFTPDKDGKNDILKPITVGIVQLHYFSIYNRWGQQVFTTNELGKGWDGNFNGVQQSAGTFVFITEGTDYMKNKIFRKGTTVLIR